MYTSVSKTKNVTVKTMMAKTSSKTAVRPTRQSTRGSIAPISTETAISATNQNAVNNNNNKQTPIAKSKFTGGVNVAPQRIRNGAANTCTDNQKFSRPCSSANCGSSTPLATPTRTEPPQQQQQQQQQAEMKKKPIWRPGTARPSLLNRPLEPAYMPGTFTRRYRLKNNNSNLNINQNNKNQQLKLEHETSKSSECKEFSEMGIQTNEKEILNHDLLVGDIKLLMPSHELIADIERKRAAAKKKELLKVQRKFEEHSLKQEEHLTDLKEYLEKAVITKRTRKPRDTLAVDRKLMSSMDEILNREVPKSESITDIRGRIKKKELELMTLFDTVDNIQFNKIKN